ncbi:hypothetical protein B0H19DRAFT_1256452 [Mycena capillaripes]|nr:hypothetical protein B0H19DRAFT_1256452 [Mycena capillaripes]
MSLASIPRLPRLRALRPGNDVSVPDGVQVRYPGVGELVRFVLVLFRDGQIKRNAASNPPSRRTAMIDADKNAPDEERDNPAAEADAKFWAVYMSEAEKYDKSLAENWKSDVGAY